MQYPEREDLSARDLDRLEAVLDDLRQDTSLQIEAGGDLHFAFEQPPAGLGEALGLLAAVVILLVAFGSVVAMGLPIGTALLGLAVGAGSLSLVAYVVDIPAWATVIGAMVGLGVGIDYSLFVLTRFREHLAEGRSVEDAVGLSLATAGRSVVFAGGTVSGPPRPRRGTDPVRDGRRHRHLLGRPGNGARLDHPASRAPRAGRASRQRPPAGPGRRGQRALASVGAHVGRHAVAYSIGATMVLVALAAPISALRLGFPDDPAAVAHRAPRLPPSFEGGFGPGANGPLLIAVDVAGDPAVLEPLIDAVAADPGIAEVAPAPDQ